MSMYEMLKNMWIMKTITEARLGNAVIRKYITEEQKAEIMACPQVSDEV